jgi:hypothetical protein
MYLDNNLFDGPARIDRALVPGAYDKVPTSWPIYSQSYSNNYASYEWTVISLLTTNKVEKYIPLHSASYDQNHCSIPISSSPTNSV